MRLLAPVSVVPALFAGSCGRVVERTNEVVTVRVEKIPLDPADPATTRSGLAVVRATQAVLAIGLRLLGIRPLEFM